MARRLIILGLRNMRRQFRRTILTALTFAIAVFIYTVLVAVPASMDRIAESASQGLRLIVTAPNAYRLPAKDCDPIRKMTHVEACASEITFTGIYRDPRDPIISYGVTVPDIFLVRGRSEYQVPPDTLKEMMKDRRSASVGSVLMREKGWKLGQSVTIRNPSDAKMTITFIPMVELPQIFLSKDVLFDRRLLDDAVKNAYGVDIADRASFLVVRVDRAENMGLVASAIDENFHNSDSETETISETATLANYVTSIGDIRSIIYTLSIIVLLTVLLIAANSMAMMARDRMSEVAIMRVLGFRQGHVVMLLLTEAVAIGFLGAVVGAIAAVWCFRHGITLGPVTGALGYLEVRWPTAIGAVLVALIVSMLSAAWPIAEAARTAPAIGIRKVI